MNQSVQCLPPGWRLEARSPSGESKDCTITITNPRGTQIAFIHHSEKLACDLTKQLEDELADYEPPTI